MKAHREISPVSGRRVVIDTRYPDWASMYADNALPDNYRRILELRFLQGCSVKESASSMGVSVGNAKVLQHRALRLAAALSEKAIDGHHV
jgi:hypothetical protein